MKRIKKQPIKVFSTKSHSKYSAEYAFWLAMNLYIEKYHSIKNISFEQVNKSEFCGYDFWAQINGQKYTLSNLFERLHKSTITKYFSSKDLVNIHEMRNSSCTSTQNLAKSLIEQMSLKYIPFIVSYVRRRPYNVLSYDSSYNAIENYVMIKYWGTDPAKLVLEKEFREYRKEILDYLEYVRQPNKN